MTEKTCQDFNTLARLCPHGWVELQVEHHPGDSGPGGSTPQEPESSIHVARVWGLTPDDLAGVDAALEDLHRDAESFYEITRKAPHRGLLIRRVVPRPAICPSCKAVVEDKRRLALCPCGVTFIAPVGLEEVEPGPIVLMSGAVDAEEFERQLAAWRRGGAVLLVGGANLVVRDA